MKNRIYICIDLKSFYASVECRERGLDPMTTNLVVADPERTEKTICLAVSPAMKALGVPGRCRVFEIPPNIDYIMAPPRMALYMERSADIYGIYLKYIAKEDIHVYSIDEIMCDVTDSITLHIGYNNRFEKKAAHGTITMTVTTSSARQMISYAVKLYDRIIDRHTPIHRFTVTFNHVVDEMYQQYDLFSDLEELERERKLQKAMLDIKGKFGKNAILKGMNLQKGATAMERNRQIGGHKSGE